MEVLQGQYYRRQNSKNNIRLTRALVSGKRASQNWILSLRLLCPSHCSLSIAGLKENRMCRLFRSRRCSSCFQDWNGSISSWKSPRTNSLGDFKNYPTEGMSTQSILEALKHLIAASKNGGFTVSLGFPKKTHRAGTGHSKKLASP